MGKAEFHMIFQFQAGNGEAEIGRGNNWCQREATVGANTKGDRHTLSGNAVILANLNKHGQDAVIERIGGNCQTNESSEESKDKMEITIQRSGQYVDDYFAMAVIMPVLLKIPTSTPAQSTVAASEITLGAWAAKRPS